MSELKIIAVITVKESHKVEVVKALHNVVDGTRKEEGNVSYDLHVDASNSLKYTIIEVWKSQSAIDIHNESVHFAEFKSAIDGKIDGLTIDIIEKVY